MRLIFRDRGEADRGPADLFILNNADLIPSQDNLVHIGDLQYVVIGTPVWRAEDNGVAGSAMSVIVTLGRIG